MGPFKDQNFKNQVSDHSEGWQNIRKQISKIPEGGFPGYTKGNQWSTMAALRFKIPLIKKSNFLRLDVALLTRKLRRPLFLFIID